MPKNKPKKGMLKRVRITKSGRVKLFRAGGRHRRSHKSGDLLRSYRKSKYATPSEARRICTMLFIPSRGGRLRRPEDAQGGAAAD